MSKHTPWEIEWGNPIAIGYGVAFVSQSLDGTHTATAYLISQAPAMLEALEELLKHGTFDDYPNTHEWVAVKNAYAAIRAAKREA